MIIPAQGQQTIRRRGCRGQDGIDHSRGAAGLPLPAAAVVRAISAIVAVYRTEPVMVVSKTADGTLLERSLPELAHVHELLPPQLWQELVEQYQVFQIR